MTIDDINYLVDEYVNALHDFFSPEQQLFLSSEVTAGSEEVFTATYFSVKHTLANFVPSSAILQIRIPP